jgi:hypothetical protein
MFFCFVLVLQHGARTMRGCGRHIGDGMTDVTGSGAVKGRQTKQSNEAGQDGNVIIVSIMRRGMRTGSLAVIVRRGGKRDSRGLADAE